MRSLLAVSVIAALVGVGSLVLSTGVAMAADKLETGSIAVVTGTDGAGLRVRSAPGVSNRILTTVPDGQRVQIIGGPTLAGGLEWYQVKSDTTTGWSNGRYLTPDRAPKSASPAPAAAYASELVAPGVDVPAGARAFISKTTGYATGNPGVGTRTATGTTVRWGTVAVDPSVIPFGSQMLIDGFDGTVFTAEDRGGGVRGTHVDIFFPDGVAASKYGTQQRRVTMIREGYGR